MTRASKLKADNAQSGNSTCPGFVEPGFTIIYFLISLQARRVVVLARDIATRWPLVVQDVQPGSADRPSPSRGTARSDDSWNRSCILCCVHCYEGLKQKDVIKISKKTHLLWFYLHWQVAINNLMVHVGQNFPIISRAYDWIRRSQVQVPWDLTRRFFHSYCMQRDMPDRIIPYLTVVRSKQWLLDGTLSLMRVNPCLVLWTLFEM